MLHEVDDGGECRHGQTQKEICSAYPIEDDDWSGLPRIVSALHPLSFASSMDPGLVKSGAHETSP